MGDARGTVPLLLQALGLLKAQKFVPDENPFAFFLVGLVLDVLEGEGRVRIREVLPDVFFVQPVGITGVQLQHSSI
jgi:hypothetical protein